MPLNPRSDHARPPHPRRKALRLLLASLIALAAPLSRADTIPAISAGLHIEEGDVLLSAEFAFALTPSLEEALEKGIRCISRSIQLVRTRFLWFPQRSPNGRFPIASRTPRSRASIAQSADRSARRSSRSTMCSASSATSRRGVARHDLVKGARYEASVRGST
jgi:hypothetical protein